VPFALGVWWIPESPTHLLSRHRVAEAIEALRILDREPILEDYLLPESYDGEPAQGRPTKSVFALMRQPSNFKPFLCGLTLMGFFQVTSVSQGCQMVSFQTKTTNFGIFWRTLEWKMLLNISGHLEYFTTIGYTYIQTYLIGHLVFLPDLLYVLYQ
jgi:hypothetical protein